MKELTPPVISLALPSQGLKVVRNTDYTFTPDIQHSDVEGFKIEWVGKAHRREGERDNFKVEGGLDESYAVAFNDVDFCVRVRQLGEVMSRAAEVLPDKDAPWLVYCRTGRRSADAVQKLDALGYTNIYDLGGILSWPYEIEGDFEGHF